MLEKVLKTYDSFLKYKKGLNGKIEIIRDSVFNATQEYPIMTIMNQYIGSGRWLRNRLIMSDTQRVDIFADVDKMNARRERHNNAKYENVSKEVGQFMYDNEKIIL